MAKQIVLITGVDGALGRIVSQHFIKQGCEVIGTSHPKSPASTPTDRAPRSVSLDLSDAASVKKVLSSLGPIDSLVHCAGGFRYAPIDATSDSDFEFLLNANLKSTFYLLRELVPIMKTRNFGRLVLVSANATRSAPAGMGAYCATKSAVNALVSSVAEEVKNYNININAIMPTIIDTPANRRDMPEANTDAWVKCEQIAEIVFSLTQPWGNPINGALIPVAGRV